MASRYLELRAEDRAALAELGGVLERRFDELLDRLIEAYRESEELAPALPADGLAEMLQPGLREYVDALKNDRTGAFLEKVSGDIERQAAQGVAYEMLVVAIMGLEQIVTDIIRSAFTTEESARAIRTPFLRFGHMYLERAAKAYLAGKEATIGAQQTAMLALSTPVVEVWDGILALPLVGTIDTARARQITQALLRTIRDTQARIVILDITGVPLVDTKVANHLMKTIRAARLLGARGIVVGISPEIADTLVTLDVTLDGIDTYFSLRQGLEAAIAMVGARVVHAGVAV